MPHYHSTEGFGSMVDVSLLKVYLIYEIIAKTSVQDIVSNFHHESIYIL